MPSKRLDKSIEPRIFAPIDRENGVCQDQMLQVTCKTI